MNLRTKEKDIIAKEGYPIIGGSFAASVIFYKMGIKSLAIGSGIFGLFSLYFFRNPSRIPPIDKNAIVSPADGVVISIGNAYERHFLKKEVKRISIFMSLFNVHVNRSPADCRVLSVVHKRGEFLAAFEEKASVANEQTALLLDLLDFDRKIVVVQIAGLVARRVVTYPQSGDKLEKGEIFGMIKFGSRLDVYVDGDFSNLVKLNQKVKAGASVLGFLI